jgi:hypothetical protein
LLSRAAAAQDTPPTPTSPPTAPTAPPGPPPDAPPPFAEPSPAPAQPGPPDTSQPVEPPPPAPSPPAQQPSGEPAPKTGAASFEPLPAPASEKPRAPKPAPASPNSSAASPETPRAEPSAPPRRASANAESALASSAAAPEGDHDSDDTNGVFGPFRLGFLIGGGLPDLVSLGGILKLTRYFGAGINVGLIPTVHLSLYGDATLSFQEYDAYGHIFPFGGSFFLGAGVGYATVHGTLATNFNLKPFQQMYPGAGVPPSLDVSSQASVRTLVLTPQLGLLHTFGSGFSIGADIGAQLPIAPSQVDFSTQIPSSIPAQFSSQIKKQYIDPNDAKVRSSLDKIGRTPVPTFNIKIGFLL